MATSRYNVVYTTRHQERGSTLPSSGSFVAFTEIHESGPDAKMSSHPYIFKVLIEATTKGEGQSGWIRKFVPHNHSPTKDSEIKAIAVKRYKKRLKKAAICHSTNIQRKVRGFGEFIHSPQTQFQFYEYIEGSTLEECKFKNETEVLEVVASLIEDLKNFHAAGYTHGDLHQKNIIVTEEKCSEEKQSKKSVKIIDFDRSKKFSRFNNNAIDWDFKCLADLLEWILYRSDQFHLSQNSKCFIKQIHISLYQKKHPSLERIKENIATYLLLIKEEMNEFQYSKNLLAYFLSEQIYFLDQEEKTNSKGAGEKKERFENIKEKLSKITQPEELKNLIMETAIVAHHRRKRTRDQLGYIFKGFFTLGLGFCTDWWDTDAYSWKCWKSLEFQKGSEYATTYNSSLANATRTFTVGSTFCNNYEDLRLHTPFPFTPR